MPGYQSASDPQQAITQLPSLTQQLTPLTFNRTTPLIFHARKVWKILVLTYVH